MASLNKVMLIGNLTRDPEVKYTPKGSAICEISLAVNRYYTNDNGEKIEETTFIDVTLWNKTAELAGKWLHKGRPVYIEGRLQLDSWEDKQSGQKRYKLRVVGDQMQFLGSSQGGGERGAGGGGDEGGGYQQRRQAGGGGGGYQGGGGGGGAGGGYQQRAQQRPAPQQRPAAEDDFGEGPITDDLDGDEIPF